MKLFATALVGALFLIAQPTQAAEYKIPEMILPHLPEAQTFEDYLDQPDDGTEFVLLGGRQVQRTVVRGRGTKVVASIRVNRVNRVNVVNVQRVNRVNVNVAHDVHVQNVRFVRQVNVIRSASIAYAYQPHIAVQAHYAAYDPCAVPAPVPVPIENQSSQQTERLIQALGAHAQAMASHGQAIESLHRTLKGPAPKQE